MKYVATTGRDPWECMWLKWKGILDLTCSWRAYSMWWKLRWGWCRGSVVVVCIQDCFLSIHMHGLETPVAVRMPNTRLDGFWDPSDSTPTSAYCPLLSTYRNPELPQLRTLTVVPPALNIHKAVLGGDKMFSCDLIPHQISFQPRAEHKSSFSWSLVQRALELNASHTLG